MDWDTVIKAFASLLMILLSALTPVVGVAIHRRFTAAQIALLGSLADTAVRAVEQVLGSGSPPSIGGPTSAQKFAAASTYLEDLAAKVHINLQPHEIEPLIEAAVHTLHTFGAPALVSGEVVHLPAAPVFSSASAALDTDAVEAIVRQTLLKLFGPLASPPMTTAPPTTP